MSMNRGFTLIELLVSVAIFVLMTALVVAKYGNFNTSTLLTDTAYDVALAMRTAQTYGLSVKNAAQGAANFNVSYGVDVYAGSSGSNACGSAASDQTHMILFADTNENGVCESSQASGDADVSTYTMTRGAVISGVCAVTGMSCTPGGGRLDVTYLRPNPEAKICLTVGGSTDCSGTYAQVAIKGTDGSTRSIAIYQNGQISVLNQ